MHEAKGSVHFVNRIRSTRLGAISFAGLVAVLLLGGCSSQPKAQQTGFISDYSMLRSESDSLSRYASQSLAKYESFIVDDVEIRTKPGALTESDLAEVAIYFRDEFMKVIQAQQLKVVTRPGVGVARVRIALTDVAGSTWWQKIHPASRAMGAGTGGAAMEGEVIDSVTGAQLAAVVQAGTGNQFNLTSFSTLDDVKGAIDKWTEQAATRLKELRASVR